MVVQLFHQQIGDAPGYSPVKYPTCGRRAWEFGSWLGAERQIVAKRGDSRSVADRAGAVSGLNLGPSAA